jgi:hypothetical protein
MIRNRNFKCPGSVDAVIYMKDGRTRYGLLVDDTMMDPYCFIPSGDLDLYLETRDPNYIEIIGGAQIEAIDIDLK